MDMNIVRVSPLKALIVGVVIIGTFAPVPSQAATTEDLVRQVAALTAQVTELQMQLASLTGYKSAFTVTALPKVATFDQRSYTSTSHNPEVGGSANVPSVFVIIRNSKFEGLVGTGEPVTNGTWTYKSVVALPSGYYTVDVFGGDTVVTRNMHVL